jgi:hypothetical protein
VTAVLRRLALPLAGAAVVVTALALGWALWPSGATATVLHGETPRYTVALTIDRPRIGTTAIEVDVVTYFGAAAPATVSVEPTMPLLGLAVPPVGASARSVGHFWASDVTLLATGPCELRIILTDRQGKTSQLVLPFTVSG